MKKIGLIILLLVTIGLLLGCGATTPTVAPSTAVPPTAAAVSDVTLKLGSWRPDDVVQMTQILAKFSEKHPHITVSFDPTEPTQYDAALKAQLAGGSGPDLFYLRSYAVSRQLYNEGYLAALDDVTGLKDNFIDAARAPWSTDDSQAYGVPFIAVSHGIYYNVDLFEKHNLEVPKTWAELLTVAQKLKAANVTPFANASGDGWTMAELVFMNLAPNFVGGLEGRTAYLNGTRCFNDEQVTATFQAIKDIALYFPQNQELLTYPDSQQLFVQGQAAMWLSGSWDIAFFETQKMGFEWSVFAPPPPADQPPYITFQLDVAIGLNKASQHQAEAKLFLEWLTSSDAAEALGNQLPGFFPMRQQMPTLANAHANSFLSLNNGRGLDVRFVWEKLRDGQPSAYDLVQNGAVAVANGQQTPQEAADALQAGLAQWFEPAKNCKK